MVLILIAVAVVLVVAIAFVAVGQETVNLTDTPTRAFFDIDEATNFVADRLPSAVAAKLSYDDVELLVRWHLTYLRERGVATFGGIDHAAEQAAQAGVVVIADEDETVDELLARARTQIPEIEAVDVVCVTDLTAEYLVEIGAVGSPVEDDELQALAAGQALAALRAAEMAELEAATQAEEAAAAQEEAEAAASEEVEEEQEEETEQDTESDAAQD